MIKKIVIFFLLFNELVVFSQNRPGLNIFIYKHISGLWNNINQDITFNDPNKYFVGDFGWGKSKYYPNSHLLIDPINNEFQWSGLHLLYFKSFKLINDKIVEIEINFFDNNIIRYQIIIDENGDILFKDNGSTTEYEYEKVKQKRVSGPDFKNSKYGKINSEKVRIRENPNLSGKIIGIIPVNDKVMTILKSEKPEIINNESFYWFKIVSDSGFVGWVYGKYIDFE